MLAFTLLKRELGNVPSGKMVQPMHFPRPIALATEFEIPT